MSLCPTCNRDPIHRVNSRHECSHVDCPNRRKAWSERPDPRDFPPPPRRRGPDPIGGLFDDQEV